MPVPEKFDITWEAQGVSEKSAVISLSNNFTSSWLNDIKF